MKKAEKEYREKYGEIPKDYLGRLDYILSQVRSNRSIKGKILSGIDRIRKIEWEEISYVIWLVPKGTPRPRTSFRNHFYVSGAADNKKIFEKFISAYSVAIIQTPCKFYCDAYLSIPSSMKISEQILAELGFIRPIVKPDFDNLAKTYSDMIQDLLLYDDALIIEGLSRKFYSVKPRIEIRIEYMKEFDSEFNYKKMKKSIERKE